MNKFILILLLSVYNIFSQNLQVHYDFGKDRDYITTTFEMFKPDEYGASFFFIDFDYNIEGISSNKGMSLAYFELARYMLVYDKISFTVQYNDGIAITNDNFGFSLNQTFLSGISYPIDLGFVTLNTDLLIRIMMGSEAPDAQLTIYWLVPFLNGRVHFTGFFDIWTQNKILGQNEIKDKKMVLLTEPQIWYNLDNHISAGTEIEISNNFLPGGNKITVNPTFAIKWTF